MKKYVLALFLLVPAAVVALALFVARGHGIAVLHPAGIIAHKERNLMLFASLLSLLVVIPVFGLLFGIAWKYRAGNTAAVYRPDWDGSRRLETIWWTVPLLLILILSVVAWRSSHDLDPFKPLVSNVKPLTIQVVALDWKWLFIYPEQHVASVNYLQVPVGTPLNFQITADAPMNSFWIPSLGGQIYAMAGMSTELHLQADTPGDYAGSSANISGRGFADMRFTTRAGSAADFRQWVNRAKQSPSPLTELSYHQLVQPSVHNSPAYYTADDFTLYDRIVDQYMTPDSALAAAETR